MFQEIEGKPKKTTETREKTVENDRTKTAMKKSGGELIERKHSNASSG
jgi:hypothetical protein